MKTKLQIKNRIPALPVLAALALCAGTANAQGVWTNTGYDNRGRVSDVKAMPNGDAWVARSGNDATRRGPAVYSADSAAWNYNPNGWNDFPSVFRDSNPGVARIAVNGTGQIVIGTRTSGVQSIAFYNGSTWSELTGDNLYRGTSDIWAAPTGEFLISKRFDNGNVFRTGTSTANFGTVESIKGNLPNADYWAMSATSLSNVLVATDSGLYRSTNAGGAVGDVTWSQLVSTRFDALHVVSDSFAVMGGQNGLVAYWNGSAVTTLTTPFTNVVNDVYALSPNSIWAVGDGGLAQYWDGTAWSALDLPGIVSTLNLQSIDVNANGVGFISAGDSLTNSGGVVWTTVAIPEPGTLMLMGLGAGALLLSKLFKR